MAAALDRNRIRTRAATLAQAAALAASSASFGAEPSNRGQLIANGKTIELPWVYVYAEEKGYYDEADPTWQLVFSAAPIAVRELDEFFTPGPYVKVGITLTAEFDDQRKLQVYTQNVKLASDSANLSGGTYPEIALDSTGPDRFAGRLHLPQPHTFFDDTFQYDFTFSAQLSHPNAPIGAPLPPGGGEPGAAYLTWVKAVHAGSGAELRRILPAEMAAMLDEGNVSENLEMLRLMTPADVTVLGGSSDGETAVLRVEGRLSGEAIAGEITMTKTSGVWVMTGQKL